MEFGLTFEPDIAQFVGQRSRTPLTVLSGPNNGGKSAVLKAIKSSLGRVAYLMGPIRFYHVFEFGSQAPDPNELDNLENQFRSTMSQRQANYEQNFMDLQKILV